MNPLFEHPRDVCHGPAIGAVLLAAGKAQSYDGPPIPLLELGGVPLIRRNLVALAGAGVEELVVVLGYRAREIEPSVRNFPVNIVYNPGHAAGRASSMRAGIADLGGRLDAIIIALADQPLINADDIRALIAAYAARDGGRVLIPRVEGQRGNPIIFDAALRGEILADEASIGCRKWIERHPEEARWFDTPSRHYIVDIDSQQDIEAFAAATGHRLRCPAPAQAQPA